MDVQLLDWSHAAQNQTFGSVKISLARVADRPTMFIMMNDLALRDNSQRVTDCTITLRACFTPPEVKTILQPKKQTLRKFVFCPITATASEQAELLPREKDDEIMVTQRELEKKKQVFQVRVGIVEGRQLQGNNIKPVVKVLVGNHVFRTRIKFGNNPYFNETFIQNFEETPAQLFDKYITIQALNSRAMRADSIIGVFKIEIGDVYESPGHTLNAKWLSLYDPANLSAGLRGYVKVNICVLGVGDHAPDADQLGEGEDIDANILRSAAVPARMATLQLYVYRAEDMPQMNDSSVNDFKKNANAQSDESDLVDSSVEVNFSGKTLRTRVVFRNANPVWNQLMSFPVQLPSMCDVIKFTVHGEHYGSTSVLGSAHLRLSHISSTGNEIEGDSSGFMPCFGPSFLTLYGSPKDYANQQGPGSEGIAYRGRILVELNTSKGTNLSPKIEDIPSEIITKTERFLSRQRYGLCAVFYSATMLANIQELIQFEVSIGNYGNKFDDTCKPFASTTQYSHAIFDGNYYYYLPWYDTKPMVAITSFWEDVGYRIDCFNIMQFMHKRLKRNLDALKAISLPSDPKLDVVWKKLQKELMEDCRRPLPGLEGRKSATILDQQMRKLRVQLLLQISKAAEKVPSNVPLQKLVIKTESWLHKIASVSAETQVSMPDVMIWMLCEEKRVAFARVKAHTIMFSKANFMAKGKLCGKTQTIFLKSTQSKGTLIPLSAQLRVRMWLGRLTDGAEFMKCCEGTIQVYAETYENQRKVHGMWGTRDLAPHPSFSDITGEISLPKDKFQLPKGWKWDGQWTVEPQRRLLLDTETNHTEVLEEVYENQIRQQPGQQWILAPIPYTTVNGTPASPKEEIVCPPGWHFEGDWKVEVNRAVDDAGWEYGVDIPPAEMPRSWSAAEKTYHTHRRRRWLRKRRRDLTSKSRQEHMTAFLRLHSFQRSKGEGWEYAPLYGWRFHLQRLSNDVFRRRCWRRKLTPEVASPVVPIFLLEGSLGVELEGQAVKGEKKDLDVQRSSSQSLLKMNTPLLFCVFKQPVYFELRCYIYQARDLSGVGIRGIADPFAQVSFLHVSQHTQILSGTLHPNWDQTLLFENVLIYGDPRTIEQDPPFVALEVFDWESSGLTDFFIGRCLCSPAVWLDLDSRKLPRLQKHLITRDEKETGHILAAFELLLDKKDGSLEKHPPPAWMDGIYTIPKGIRPILRLTAIEILAWGLRDMKNYNLLVINSPSLTVACGGESLQTPPIKNLHENPNFSINIFLMKVYLPVDEDYVPPIELKVVDHREFGYKPVVGHATIRSLSQYFCDPWEEGQSHTLPLRAISTGKLKGVLKKATPKPWFWKKPKEEKDVQKSEEEEVVDWWSKYYVTTGDLGKSGNYLERGFDSLKIYNCELESVPDFQGFQDFCQTFKLYRGKVKDESREEPMVGGEFKGLFRIYPLPEDPSVPPPPRQFQELPKNISQECLVRIYIIRAFNLQPKDRNGLCDPYIRIKLGKKRGGERERYFANTLDPIFGRMFELTCSIPLEKDLKVLLYDFDVFPPDDIIGETTIDLENRLLSRFGANCGLPQSYCISGPSQWRDQLPPSQLLEHFARTKDMRQPEISADGSKAVFMGKTFLLSEFETQVPSHSHLGPPQERLALYLLRNCGLVPEHIETRTLYNSSHPGIEQGKVQMWVDLFPGSLGAPGPPFDITPRKPRKFELRCVIWNTKDVDLEDTNIFGDRMSDIYVKGWLDGQEEDKQKTDVHYRSLAGEGNFNWRFVFTMDYMPMEQVCILTKKEHFWSLDETMQKVPPKLIIQIWDNDRFSADDFLGVLEINLASVPYPAKRPRECTLKMLQDNEGGGSSSLPKTKSKRASLFVQKNMRGWWPCIVFEKEKARVSGKVEMTLELLTDKEAEERPAGKGREEPNMNPTLKPPTRPDTSFLWFTAPLKSIHFLLWQKSKWRIFGFFCILLMGLLIATFIYSSPGYLAMKLINPMASIKKPTGTSLLTTTTVTTPNISHTVSLL